MDFKKGPFTMAARAVRDLGDYLGDYHAARTRAHLRRLHTCTPPLYQGVRVVPITIVGAHVFYPAGNAAPLAPARGVTIVVHPPLPPPENKKARACCCRRDRHLLRCRHASSRGAV